MIRLEEGIPVPRKLEELAWQDRGLTTTEVLREAGIK